MGRCPKPSIRSGNCIFHRKARQASGFPKILDRRRCPPGCERGRRQPKRLIAGGPRPKPLGTEGNFNDFISLACLKAVVHSPSDDTGPPTGPSGKGRQATARPMPRCVFVQGPSWCGGPVCSGNRMSKLFCKTTDNTSRMRSIAMTPSSIRTRMRAPRNTTYSENIRMRLQYKVTTHNYM